MAEVRGQALRDMLLKRASEWVRDAKEPLRMSLKQADVAADRFDLGARPGDLRVGLRLCVRC